MMKLCAISVPVKERMEVQLDIVEGEEEGAYI